MLEVFYVFMSRCRICVPTRQGYFINVFFASVIRKEKRAEVLWCKLLYFGSFYKLCTASYSKQQLYGSVFSKPESPTTISVQNFNHFNHGGRR